MTEFKQLLLDKIKTKKARLAVIGLGYVGLPLAVEFAGAGFETVGVDVDPRKVDTTNGGESYIADVPTAQVATAVARGRLQATSAGPSWATPSFTGRGSSCRWD